MTVMYTKISVVLWRSSRMQDFEKHNVRQKSNKRWRWRKKPKTEKDIKLKQLTSGRDFSVRYTRICVGVYYSKDVLNHSEHSMNLQVFDVNFIKQAHPDITLRRLSLNIEREVIRPFYINDIGQAFLPENRVQFCRCKLFVVSSIYGF